MQALIKIVISTTYGNIAKKYETFPELLMPRTITKKMQIQANNSQSVNFQSGIPIPSEMSSFSLITSFLQHNMSENKYLLKDLHKAIICYVKKSSALLKDTSPRTSEGARGDESTQVSSHESRHVAQGSSDANDEIK